MKAYLKFKDRGGIESLAWLKDMVDTVALGAVQTFANEFIVNALTNAGIVEFGVLRPSFITLTADAGGTADPTSSVKNKARVHFQYISANSEVKSIALWIPAPDMAMFENIEGVGYRMGTLSGETLRDMLIALTGIADIVFINGILDYSESEKSSYSDNAVEFVDAEDNRCWMSVPQPVSAAALETFGNAISMESIAMVTRAVYIEYESQIVTDSMAEPMSDGNGFDSVERRCKCKFAYIAGTRRKFMTLNLPAPRSTNLVVGKDKPGYALVKVSGDALATAITTLYGSANRNVSFRNGRVNKTELDNQ